MVYGIKFNEILSRIEKTYLHWREVIGQSVQDPLLQRDAREYRHDDLPEFNNQNKHSQTHTHMKGTLKGLDSILLERWA